METYNSVNKNQARKKRRSDKIGSFIQNCKKIHILDCSNLIYGKIKTQFVVSYKSNSLAQSFYFILMFRLNLRSPRSYHFFYKNVCTKNTIVIRLGGNTRGLPVFYIPHFVCPNHDYKIAQRPNTAIHVIKTHEGHKVY